MLVYVRLGIKMRLTRTEHGCSSIVRIFQRFCRKKWFAVLEGESGYDLKISKSEMTISDTACLVLRVGSNLPLSSVCPEIKGMCVHTQK